MESKSNDSGSIPFHKSLRSETQNKFNELLKRALAKKKEKEMNKSTQNLISSDIETISSYEELGEDGPCQDNVQTLEVEVDIHSSVTNKTYIMDKFLNDAGSIHEKSDNSADSNATFVKPPVPKPRTKISNEKSVESDSHHTYSVGSAVKEEQTEKDVNSDGSRTYSVERTSHSSSSKKSLSLKREKTFLIEKVQNDKLDSDGEEIEMQEIKKQPPDSPSTTSEVESVEYVDEIKPKTHRKKSAKKKKEMVKTEAEQKDTVETKENQYKYDRIIGITLHQTDRLKLNSFVIHPVVKVHIVNAENGQYLNKTDKNRPVVFYYEDKKFSYIAPVLTQAFNLQENRSLYPAWNETIVINEDFQYILDKGTEIIFFFEIMDFLSFSAVNTLYNQKGVQMGWHKIAWAFLRPVGKHNNLNVNKKVRLQLYYPGKPKKISASPKNCEAFEWWTLRKCKEYPATLYVTIKSIVSPDKIVDTLRSKTPVQADRASIRFKNFETGSLEVDEDIVNEQKLNSEYAEMKHLTSKKHWSKIVNKDCQLPNSLYTKLSTFEEGCFCLKFSHSGEFLAYSVLIEEVYTIMVHNVDTLEEVCSFPGHQGLVYEINWSDNDKHIISASADGTASIWGFEKRNFIQMLPHPSYVYTSSISSTFVIATGGYDGILRIWTIKTESDEKLEYGLSQELTNHKEYITSSCFNKSGNHLYTSDAKGLIVEWKNNSNIWSLNREINLIDLKDIAIDSIILHKKERKLLIQTRDSILRLIDLRSSSIVSWYKGNINRRYRGSCTFSYCGTYIFSTSEDGYINVWTLNKENIAARYCPYGHNVPIHAIQYSPKKDLLAVAHFGGSHPILLYEFEEAPKINILEVRFYNDRFVNKLIKKGPVDTSRSLPERESLRKKQEPMHFKDILEKMDKIILPK